MRGWGVAQHTHMYRCCCVLGLTGCACQVEALSAFFSTLRFKPLEFLRNVTYGMHSRQASSAVIVPLVGLLAEKPTVQCIGALQRWFVCRLATASFGKGWQGVGNTSCLQWFCFMKRRPVTRLLLTESVGTSADKVVLLWTQADGTKGTLEHNYSPHMAAPRISSLFHALNSCGSSCQLH
jgi:hypothetical protein